MTGPCGVWELGTGNRNHRITGEGKKKSGGLGVKKKNRDLTVECADTEGDFLLPGFLVNYKICLTFFPNIVILTTAKKYLPVSS